MNVGDRVVSKGFETDGGWHVVVGAIGIVLDVLDGGKLLRVEFNEGLTSLIFTDVSLDFVERLEE